MKKKLIFASAIAVFLIIVGICLIKIDSHSHTLLSQRAAQVWRGESEERFAQVSAFLPLGAEADENAVRDFRGKIDPRLRDDGIDIPKEGSVWADAYSGMGSLDVTGSKGTYSANAVGVGGDFFLFHPYELLSGGYIYEDDLMGDRVVLDHELAWKLFGGSNIAGMSVTIAGKPFYIAGVVKREADMFSQKAFSGEQLIFMSYSAAAELIEGFGLSCYEVVMPDPISGYAESFVSEGFASGKAVAVQNTGRYSFGSIYGMFRDLGQRAISDTGVVYPYWENAARVSESYIARLYVIIAVAGIIPFACLVWALVLLVMFIRAKLRYGREQVKEAWDDRYARIDELQRKTRRIKKVRERKRGESARLSAPEEDPSGTVSPGGEQNYDEKALAMDIESIVREILDEET